MKRILMAIMAVAAFMHPAAADEGMWLPALISQRIGDMQAKGCRLSAEDIYSVNQASLKDAVVLFGRGCTGELVSADGLIFTNHHCGYGYIQKHSSVQHDYLKDGFWAMSRQEELPNPGLTVSFLEYMQDVTSQVLAGYDPATMTEDERTYIVNKNSKILKAEAIKSGKGLEASVEALYYGNQYFLFVFRVFRDVRLVGAPPSSIGKFGGDTDNWMWPRHTGDFSIFRIYAGKDNAPADYSEENTPYHPKKFFKISRAGVKEGDFTFVYGCPGSTKEYITSDEVRYIAEVSDPAKIALRTMRLDIQKKYMSKDQAVRIQYSSKNATTANAWKKWQGEAKGILKMGTIAAKEEYEARFAQWAKGTKYDGLLQRMHALYDKLNDVQLGIEYYSETVMSIELMQLIRNTRLRHKVGSDEFKAASEAFFKDYYRPIDEEIFTAMMTALGDLDHYQPQYYSAMMDKYGSVEAWKDDVFARSVFTSKEKVLALTEEDSDTVVNDPAEEMFSEFRSWYTRTLLPVYQQTLSELRLAYREYMQGQMEFEPDKNFYPDANLTLRIAYGKVSGYSPADGIDYRPVSTLKGIIEKDNPDIFDYNIPQTLRDIYAEGGHEDQPVCFIATNHTTGGNSGSPVLNADGNLIGINFDRVWEGTMSDIAYNPDICRNISLDVRYLLFNIKEIGHADYLFDEMVFVD